MTKIRNYAPRHGLKPRQQSALLAILTTSSLEQAAKKSGVSLSTLYLWMDNPEFAKILLEEREKQVERALSSMQSGTQAAVVVLDEIMQNPTAKNSDRIAAAKAILEYGTAGVAKARETLHIEYGVVVLPGNGRRND